MTNAQAALIAAATFLQGRGKAEPVHVEAMAARFTEWLVVEDEGAQEAASAPQADDGHAKADEPVEWLPEGAVGRCRVCGYALWQVDQQLMDRDGATAHMLPSYRDGSRPHEL